MKITINKTDYFLNYIDDLKKVLELHPECNHSLFELTMQHQEEFNHFVCDSYQLLQVINLFPNRASFLLQQALKNTRFLDNISFYTYAGDKSDFEKLISHFSKEKDSIFGQTFANPDILNKKVCNYDGSINCESLKKLLLLFPNQKDLIFKMLFPDVTAVKNKISTLTQLGGIVKLYPAESEYFFKIMMQPEEKFNCFVTDTSQLIEAKNIFPEQASFLLQQALKNTRFLGNISLYSYYRVKSDFEELISHFSKEKYFIFGQIFANPDILNKKVCDYADGSHLNCETLKKLLLLFPNQKDLIFKMLFPDDTAVKNKISTLAQLGGIVKLYPVESEYFFKIMIQPEEKFNCFVTDTSQLIEAKNIFPEQAGFLLQQALKNTRFLGNISLYSYYRDKSDFEELISHFAKQKDFIFGQIFANPDILNKKVCDYGSHLNCETLKKLLLLFPNQKDLIFKILFPDVTAVKNKISTLAQLGGIVKLYPAESEYFFKIMMQPEEKFNCFVTDTSQLIEAKNIFPEQAGFLLQQALKNTRFLGNISLYTYNLYKSDFEELISHFSKEKDFIFGQTFANPDILNKKVCNYDGSHLNCEALKKLLLLFPNQKDLIFKMLFPDPETFARKVPEIDSAYGEQRYP